MENATEALVIAGSIFLLMLALAIAISSFTGLKTEVEDITTTRDEIKVAKDEDGNYINYIKNGNDIRTVGIYEIIASFRRMRKEGYNIYIYMKNGTIPSGIPDEFIEDAKEHTYIQKNSTSKKIIDNGRIIKLTVSGGNRYIHKLDETIKILYNSDMKDKTYEEYIGIYKEETAEGVLEKENPTYKILTYVEV